jgi:phosphatidylglycerophosphate synthase
MVHVSDMFPVLIGGLRCTTSCLLCYLSSAYPAYALFFQFLISLDFASHYMHMYRQVKLKFLVRAASRDMLYLALSLLDHEATSWSQATSAEYCGTTTMTR